MKVLDDFEERKKKLFQPVLFEAGAALLDCQSFEYGVAYLLFHFARLGTVGLNSERISQILDDKEKKTAGQLVAVLKKRMKASPGLETALEEALVARNYLIHRVLTDNMEKLGRPDGREELVREIRGRRVRYGRQARRCVHLSPLSAPLWTDWTSKRCNGKFWKVCPDRDA